MSFLPHSNKAGILAGIYLVNAVVAPLTVFYNVSIKSSSSLMVRSLMKICLVDLCKFWWCHQASICSSDCIWVIFTW